MNRQTRDHEYQVNSNPKTLGARRMIRLLPNTANDMPTKTCSKSPSIRILQRSRVRPACRVACRVVVVAYSHAKCQVPRAGDAHGASKAF